MRLTAKIFIVILALLVVQLGLSVTLFTLHRNTQVETDKVKHSLSLSTTLAETLAQLALLKTLFKTLNAENISRKAARMTDKLQLLAREFKDQPDKEMVILDARDNMHDCEIIGARAQQMFRNPNMFPLAEKLIWSPLRLHILKIVDDTTKLTKILDDQEATTQRALRHEQEGREMSGLAAWIGISVEMLIIGLGFVWFQRDISRRMSIILENADRIAQRSPLLPTLGGLDEISQLDQSFHNIAQILTNADREEQQLIDKQRDVICQLTRTLEFISINEASQQTFGLSAAELHGKSLTEFIHAEDVPRLREQLSAAVSTTQPSFETRIVRQSGAIADLLWSVRWSDYGQSFFCVLHDITEQKQTEQLRQEVLQMVGHDLKSPLTTVSIFLQLAQTPAVGALTNAGSAKVAGGLEASERMSALIRDLLSLEAIRAGMFIVERERISLRDVVINAADRVDDNAAKAQVAIDLNTAEVQIDADKERLIQAIQNLIVNGVSRSQPGGKVEVEVETIESGAIVRVSVSDAGPQIPSAQITHIFDSFLPDGNQGSVANLSLALSKAIVDLHGGRLSVSSDLQRTTFAIEMPVAALATAAVPFTVEKLMSEPQQSKEPETDIPPVEEPAGEEEFAASTIDIQLEYPRDYILFVVPVKGARATHLAMRNNFHDWIYDSALDEYMKAVVFHPKLSVNILPNAEIEEFYRIVEEGPLPVDMQGRCFQAEMIIQLLVEGDDQLTYFAPFWTAVIAGHFYATDLDAILVDLYNSPAYAANVQFWRYQSLGVPLTHQFLSVTGNTDANGKLSMHTTGMRRFALPELQIHGVNPAFGPDIAYFLRGLGQYMWSAIEKLIPGSTMLQLTEELDFSTSFCELDKSTARNLHGTLLPLSLAYEDSPTTPRLIVQPTLEFDKEDDWFHLIVQTLRKDKYLLETSVG